MSSRYPNNLDPRSINQEFTYEHSKYKTAIIVAVISIIVAIISGVFSIITARITSDASLEIAKMQTNYLNLEADYNILKGDYDTLTATYITLKEQHVALEHKYNELIHLQESPTSGGDQDSISGNPSTANTNKSDVASEGKADISELVPYDTRGGSLGVNRVRDMADTWHDNAMTIQPRYNISTYYDYLLNETYKKIEGLTFAMYGSTASLVGANLKIWGNDVLLFDAGAFQEGLAPIYFDIPLDGVKVLTIGWEFPPGSGRMGAENVMCTTATLYK